MGFVDFILNLVGLLLWLYWRTLNVAPVALPGKSLLALLQPTDRPRTSPGLLLFLAGLLVVRAFFYWQIGPPLHWAPALPLGAIAPQIRSDYLGYMLLYSLLSFARWVAAFYLGLLLLSLVNRHVADAEPLQKWVRLHLGWFERWPVLLKLPLPVLAIAMIWMGLHPALVRLTIIPASQSFNHLVQQAVVVGAGGFLAWKYLLVALLLLHLVNSYVYLGRHSLWNFIQVTGGNLLRPLQALSLRVGKFDFTPLVAAALVWAIAWALGLGLTRLYQQLPL